MQLANATFKSKIYTALLEQRLNVVLKDDSVSWTGADVLEKIENFKNLIVENSSIGSRIGVSFPNWAVQVLAMLTVISTGRVPVMLSFSDLSTNSEDWLKRAQVTILITATGIESLLTKQVQFIVLSRQGEVKSHFFQTTFFSLNDLIAPLPPGTGLVLYTSGSTGAPKGICIPEQGILETANYLISTMTLSQSTISPIILPICHSMALNTQFIPTLLAGGTSVFVNPRLSITKIFRTILAEKGTFVSLIGEILRTCWEEKNRRNLPPAWDVKHVQIAGGMISLKSLELAKELFPNAIIHKGYGLTEAIRVTMINSSEKNFQTSSVGRPLPFVDVEIRDVDGCIATPERLGEIYVKGPNVFLGLSNRSGSVVGADGFMATGDFGFWNNDGQICIAGRRDSLLKVNGHRVSGLEIEQIALDTCELINHAKCTIIDDPRRDSKKLVLLVEIHKDVQDQFMKDHLAEVQQKLWLQFKSLSSFPREVIVLTKFPRTSNGKIDLKKLLELAMTPQKKSIQKTMQSNLQFYQVRFEEYERISV